MDYSKAIKKTSPKPIKKKQGFTLLSGSGKVKLYDWKRTKVEKVYDHDRLLFENLQKNQKIKTNFKEWAIFFEDILDLWYIKFGSEVTEGISFKDFCKYVYYNTDKFFNTLTKRYEAYIPLESFEEEYEYEY